MVQPETIWKLDQQYIDKVPMERAEHGWAHWYLIIAGNAQTTTSTAVVAIPITKRLVAEEFCTNLLQSDHDFLEEKSCYVWCHYPITLPAKYFRDGYKGSITPTAMKEVKRKFSAYFDLIG